MTWVIVRDDDVTQRELALLSTWLAAHGHSIPVCTYAFRTHQARYWNARGWQLAARLIQDSDWEIGGHTLHHPRLSRLSLERLTAEVHDNCRQIETGLSTAGLSYRIFSFAYPFGDYNADVQRVIAASGIRCGLSYRDGSPVVQPLPLEYWLSYGVTAVLEEAATVEALNARFDSIAREGGLYILSLHTRYWCTRWRDWLRWPERRKFWGWLDIHLRYMEQAGADFTTFARLHGAKDPAV